MFVDAVVGVVKKPCDPKMRGEEALMCKNRLPSFVLAPVHYAHSKLVWLVKKQRVRGTDRDVVKRSRCSVSPLSVEQLPGTLRTPTSNKHLIGDN